MTFEEAQQIIQQILASQSKFDENQLRALGAKVQRIEQQNQP
jgi:hypothetical protein